MKNLEQINFNSNLLFIANESLEIIEVYFHEAY